MDRGDQPTCSVARLQVLSLRLASLGESLALSVEYYIYLYIRRTYFSSTDRGTSRGTAAAVQRPWYEARIQAGGFLWGGGRARRRAGPRDTKI